MLMYHIICSRGNQIPVHILHVVDLLQLIHLQECSIHLFLLFCLKVIKLQNSCIALANTYFCMMFDKKIILNNIPLKLS